MTAQETYEAHEAYFKVVHGVLSEFSSKEVARKPDVPKMPEDYAPSLVTGRCRCVACRTHRKP